MVDGSDEEALSALVIASLGRRNSSFFHNSIVTSNPDLAEPIVSSGSITCKLSRLAPVICSHSRRTALYANHGEENWLFILRCYTSATLPVSYTVVSWVRLCDSFSTCISKA